MLKDRLYEITCTPIDRKGYEVEDSVSFVIEIPDYINVEQQLEKKRLPFERMALEYCRIRNLSASFCKIRKIEKFGE